MVDVDRIAAPWGTRTPYGPGQTWPSRTDTFLADGLSPDDVDRWVPSASILHSNGDALDIAVTLRQMRWANAKVKETAAQVMVTR